MKLARRTDLGSRVAVVLVTLGCLTYQPATGAQTPTARRYRIIDLGTLGGFFSRALAINNRGQIAGESLVADNADVQAFYWNAGEMRSLTPYVPGSLGHSSAVAINDDGVVVGRYDPSAFPNTPPIQAFRYDPRTGTLGFLGGEGSGTDINDAGQILTWSPGGYHILGGVNFEAAFGGSVTANAINAAGEVAIVASLPGGGAGGFVYKQGIFEPVAGFHPSDLNDVGAVAGSYVENLGLFGLRGRVAMRERDGTLRTFTPLNFLANARPSAINNLGQIVGIESGFINSRFVRTAFIIEEGVTRPLSALLPPNSGWELSGDFGEAHDINDRGEIVGTGLINGEWHAFLLTPLVCSSAEDSDGDGNGDDDEDALCDTWETEGVDGDSDGDIDLFLGTNPERKDLFVEVDYMVCAHSNPGCAGIHSHRPQDQGLADVVNAFANDASVVNPDLSFGITLHLQVDDAVPEIEEIRFKSNGSGPRDDFNDLKRGSPADACGADATGFLGTVLDRAHADCEAILKARELVFRYAIFGHTHAHNPRSSGIAETGGNDFMVTVGSWGDASIRANGGSGNLNTARAEVEGATFMHEFGHTLGLRHGGSDNTNCKPNYLSVMNYSFQMRHLVPNRPLNFSFPKLPTLDESQLDEALGIQGQAGQFTLSSVILPLFGPRPVVFDADGAIDWNQDLVIDQSVSRNINYVPQAGDSCRIAATTFLTSFDDWNSLQFDFRRSPDFDDGSIRSTVDPDSEHIGDDGLIAAQSVDFDGDGTTNFPDNCPAIANPGQEDTDGDGAGDACASGSPADAIPPVLTLPATITEEATSPSGASVHFTATANDNVDGALSVTCAPPSGGTFALGVTAVSCSATDSSGNAVNGRFDVIVRDTTAPSLTLPAGPIIAAATAPSGATVAFTATAHDIVDGAVGPLCSPTAASIFPLGNTNVNCSATDSHGNTRTGTFTVTVIDPPTPGKMVGSGRVDASDGSTYRFSFESRELDTGAHSGYFQVEVCTPRPGRSCRRDVFASDGVAFMRFTGDTVLLAGPGWWNGQSGYSFEVLATDRGEPGAGRDTIGIVVKAPGGATVATVSGVIRSGNLQAKPWQ